MDLTHALHIARLSDIGQYRTINEDAVASDSECGIVVLADGIGGYQAGEIASEITTLTVMASMREHFLGEDSAETRHVPDIATALKQAVTHTNQTIYQLAQQYPACQGMGTTVVAGVFFDNQLLIAHVGDSRLYRLRSHELTALTEDHSLVQEWVRDGVISKQDAANSPQRNLLTRALGTDAKVEIDLNTYPVELNDIYLLCTDGLTDHLDDAELLTILTQPLELTELALELVRRANQAGGRDNISVIIIKVLEAFPAPKKWYKTLIKR